MSRKKEKNFFFGNTFNFLVLEKNIMLKPTEFQEPALMDIFWKKK